MKPLQPRSLSTLLAITALLSACGITGPECSVGPDAPVRLIWFGTDASGDPAFAENPHVVYQATASDGVNFESATKIFEADDLVDPDFFPVPEASGGGFGLIWSSHADGNLYYAHSDTVDGTYADVGGAITTGGQSSTLLIDSALTSFITGVQSFPLSISTSGASIVGGDGSKLTVINVDLLREVDGSLADGIVGDPTVIRVQGDSNPYRAFVKYAPGGAQPNAHEMWTLTSSDGVAWEDPQKLRDGASVPGAVAVGDTIFVYFVDFSGDYSNGSIAVGYSTDNGATFEYSSVCLDGAKITGAYDPAALPAN